MPMYGCIMQNSNWDCYVITPMSLATSPTGITGVFAYTYVDVSVDFYLYSHPPWRAVDMKPSLMSYTNRCTLKNSNLT